MADELLRSRTSKLLKADGVAALVVACLGVTLTYAQKQVYEGAALSSLVVAREFRRQLVWWGAGTASAFVMVVVSGLLFSQWSRSRRGVRLLPGAAGLLGLLAIGPAAVSSAVELTKSRTSFECILPGPILLWFPSVVAAVALILVGHKLRRPGGAA